MEPTLPIGSSELWVNLLILLISVMCVAFFSSSEASLISVNRVRLRNMVAQGHGGARVVQRVLGRHDKFFATILLTENAFIIFASSFGTAVFLGLFHGKLPEEQIILLSTVVMTVLVVIFGEITPKTLAALMSEKVSLIVARPISWIMALETPLIWFFTLVPRAIIGLAGQRLHTGSPFVTEAELRMLIDIGETEGIVEEHEMRMLHRVFEFTDKVAREVMTPRPEIQWLDKDAVLADFLPRFAESYHTRYLLCDGDPDHVVGVLHTKDVLRAMASGDRSADLPLAQFLRPAYFVPETKRIGSLFEEMQAAGQQMAVVVDEYGGTAGLLTLKQVVEEIVGRLGDEITGHEAEFEAIDDRTFQVDGSMRVDEANEALDLDLPEGDYETVAGFVLDALGRIPREGEQVRHNDLRILVTEMNGVKIEKVRVTKA